MTGSPTCCARRHMRDAGSINTRGEEGLYAVGRTAVGLASNLYVSGISLADCIWSGRNAGRHIAAGGRQKLSSPACCEPTT